MLEKGRIPPSVPPLLPPLLPALHTHSFSFFLTFSTFIPGHWLSTLFISSSHNLGFHRLSLPPSIPIYFLTVFFFKALFPSLDSFFSLPAGCLGAVWYLMFLWEVIKAWITDCMCMSVDFYGFHTHLPQAKTGKCLGQTTPTDNVKTPHPHYGCSCLSSFRSNCFF